MPVMFLIFFGSDLSKMDQTWSNWISHQSKNKLDKVGGLGGKCEEEGV